MKKKSLVTMAVSLALVAVIGVGSTFAYLSSTTGEVKNTFTVGNVKISIDEDKYDTPENANDRTETGNDYKDIYPGQEIKKDPTVYVEANSAKSYVYLKVEGLNALATTKAKDADGKEIDAFSVKYNGNNGLNLAVWKKVEGTGTGMDGIYRYIKGGGTVAKSETRQTLDPLFDQIVFNAKVEINDETDPMTIADIKVKACAVQAEGVVEADAFIEASRLLNK